MLKRLADTWTAVKETWSKQTGEPGINLVTTRVASVVDDPRDAMVRGAAFAPERSYFSVRLVEMRLGDHQAFLTNFLPMFVCLAEYSYGFERRVVPYVVNNDIIKQGLQAAAKATGDKKLDAGYVEFGDLYVVHRAPVKSTPTSLFTGLFRIPHDDFGAKLLDVVGKIGRDVGVPVGSAVGVARTLYEGFGDIFKLSNVAPRFGDLNGDTLAGGSGYIVHAGSAIVPGDLQMQEGRLQQRTGGRYDRPRGFDYCVVALEYLETLVTPGNSLLTTLPFHREWRTVRQHLMSGKPREAQAANAILLKKIADSPDLTESDAIPAIAAYNTMYHDVDDAMKAKTGDKRAGSVGLLANLEAEADERRKSNHADDKQIGRALKVYSSLNSKRAGEASTAESDDHDAGAISGFAIAARGPLLSSLQGKNTGAPAEPDRSIASRFAEALTVVDLRTAG